MSVLVEQLLVSLVLLGVRLAQNLLRAWRVVVPILVGAGAVVLLSSLVGWVVAVAFVGMASVTLVGLPSRGRSEWPVLSRREVSLWDPILIGSREGVRVNCATQSCLIAGTTGGGKSVLLSMFVASAALDPAARLFLIDWKRVELGHWRPVAQRFEHEPEKALGVLRDAVAEIEDRAAWLERQRGIVRKLEPRHGFGPVLVAIDELATYTGKGSKVRDEFDALLLAIASKGRFVAVSVVACTQTPYRDVLWGMTAANFPKRISFWCETSEQSRAILGSDAAVRLPQVPGRCIVRDESGVFVEEQTYHVTDEQLELLVERAQEIRS